MAASVAARQQHACPPAAAPAMVASSTRTRRRVASRVRIFSWTCPSSTRARQQHACPPAACVLARARQLLVHSRGQGIRECLGRGSVADWSGRGGGGGSHERLGLVEVDLLERVLEPAHNLQPIVPAASTHTRHPALRHMTHATLLHGHGDSSRRHSSRRFVTAPLVTAIRHGAIP